MIRYQRDRQHHNDVLGPGMPDNNMLGFNVVAGHSKLAWPPWNCNMTSAYSADMGESIPASWRPLERICFGRSQMDYPRLNTWPEFCFHTRHPPAWQICRLLTLLLMWKLAPLEERLYGTCELKLYSRQLPDYSYTTHWRWPNTSLLLQNNADLCKKVWSRSVALNFIKTLAIQHCTAVSMWKSYWILGAALQAINQADELYSN